MRREDRSVDIVTVERPAMAGHRSDLDGCGVGRPVRVEEAGERNAAPALFGPPATGAVEDRRDLPPRQRREILERERHRTRDLAGPDESPCGWIQRRDAVEGPARARGVVPGERARVA